MSSPTRPLLAPNPSPSSFALYKRVLNYLWPYWPMMLASIVSMIIAATTEPAFAALMKPLIDGGFAQQSNTVFGLQAMVWVPLSIVLLFTVRGLSEFVNAYTTSWFTGHLVQTLRAEMFQNMLNLPVAYYEKNNSGRLISRVTNDVTQVTAAGFNVVTIVIKDGITTLGLVATLFYIDWQLALICLTVFPLVIVSVKRIAKKLRQLSRKDQQDMADMTQILSESIDCQRVIKIDGGAAYEMNRFQKTANAVRRNAVKQSTINALNTGTTQLMIACALAAILYFAAHRAQQGSFTAGDFMSFLTAMLLMFPPFKRIANISQTLQKGLAAAESVFDFIDLPVEKDSGQQRPLPVTGQLQFNNVTFQYDSAQQPALKNINLTINAGKTVAFVGSSGSGKTTLVSLLPRFYDLQSGQILLDDIDLHDWSLSHLRDNVALVSQDVVLFNDTVAANIAYSFDGAASREAVIAAAQAAHAYDFIQAMPNGFDTLIGENGVLLSGGQRQRLAIARALFKNAPILILDEATSALDTQSERSVQAALDNLMQNRTTLIIAHRLSTIENADEIVVMHQGQIAEQGSHAQLIQQNGLYTQLHALQLSAHQINAEAT
jgi:subfamily B ATP-binding cassette protein MsbA